MDLPNSLLLDMMHRMPPTIVCILGSVNQRLRHLSHDKSLWVSIFMNQNSGGGGSPMLWRSTWSTTVKICMWCHLWAASHCMWEYFSMSPSAGLCTSLELICPDVIWSHLLASWGTCHIWKMHILIDYTMSWQGTSDSVWLKHIFYWELWVCVGTYTCIVCILCWWSWQCKIWRF